MTLAGADTLVIRPATPADDDALWAVLAPIYRAGETYCIPQDITRADALADWHASPFQVFVATLNDRVVGSSHIGANRGGNGAHIANASFATHPDARGKGVAGALVTHAKDWARNQGFRAMQFNFVVSTNDGAIRAWERAGFRILCRLPGAFNHPRLGYVDGLVMFSEL